LDDKVKGHVNLAAAVGMLIVNPPGASEWLFCGAPAINATAKYIKTGVFKDIYVGIKNAVTSKKDTNYKL